MLDSPGAMATQLLIVESPGKLKTLRKILGPGWILEASVGHTTELAHDGAKRLGFEFEGDHVITRYVPRGPRGRQILAKLRKAVQQCDRVYLATDPDREGEAIAWHLVQQLRLKNYVRVSYTQITDAAVKAAIARPTHLNAELIHAQRARQCLDKLVGFEVSPLLWGSTGGRSAGRVQSATLHLICERERERLAFVPEDYWVLKSRYREGFEAVFERQPVRTPPAPIIPSASALITSSTSTLITSSASAMAPPPEEGASRVRTESEAKAIAQIARTHAHIVRQAESRPETRNPPPPLITSSLQQAAGGRFRYSPKKTMEIAQALYEGVGGKGLITYMRTDSITLSPEFAQEARAWLSANAPEALAEHAPTSRAKAAGTQGAHEAIRPTSAALTPNRAHEEHGLSTEQLNIYRLVWERAIASQCKPAILSKTKITIDCAETRWIARGTVIVNPGYLKFWKNLEDERPLPVVRVGQRLDFQDVAIEAKTTQPPSRYSEPKLVQLMEKKGIGRPSTYASTIATIKDRDYVVLEQSLLAPTPLGMACDDALSRAIPELVDAAFTAQMERSLDEVAEGKLDWERYLIGWNQSYLAPALVRARESLKTVSRVAPERKFGRGRRAGKTQGLEKNKRKRGKKSIAGSVPPTKSARASTRKPSRRTLSRASKSPQNPGDLGTPASRLEATAQARLDSAAAQARSFDRMPKCPDGHGEMVPRLSKKGAVYWKCGHTGCEAFAWNQEFSEHKCPDCGSPMEKISTPKVTGGYFLKCNARDRHAKEIVLFRNRKTLDWEKGR